MTLTVLTIVSEAPTFELSIDRNNLGLHEATLTLTLPPITVSCQKADRDDLEYQLRNDMSEIVAELTQKLIKSEF